jgi:hypothetical protein
MNFILPSTTTYDAFEAEELKTFAYKRHDTKDKY